MIVKSALFVLVLLCFSTLINTQDPGNDGPTLFVDPTCAGTCGAQTFPSIKAALDALPAEGGTIILGAGTYLGADNTNLVLVTPVTIKSENLDSAGTIIDCEGNGFGFTSNGQQILFDSFTITQCTAEKGAGLNVENGVNTTLVRMIFSGNTATGNGGAVWQEGGLLNILDSQFNGNTAMLGSALFVTGVNTIITATAFNDNSIANGNVVGCANAGTVTFQGESTINNEDLATIAGQFCLDCTLFVDTNNLCEAPVPALPVTPPVTAPAPVAPVAPVAPTEPTPVAPVEPIAPVEPTEPTPVAPTAPPTASPEFVPIFGGPSFGSGSSIVVNSLVFIGCSVLLAII